MTLQDIDELDRATRKRRKSLESQIDIMANGCWRWKGATAGSGYPSIRLGSSVIQAHRYIYELANGKLPLDIKAHHECENTLCVNPKHIKPVTHGENIQHFYTQHPRTHCHAGHEYTPENTHYYGVFPMQERVCRACQRKKKLAYYHANKRRS